MPSSSSSTLDPQSKELLRKMGTPSRLAMTTCKDVLGFDFDPAKHIVHMERRLLAAIGDTKNRRFLSISMPPRHGKSIYCSVFLAAWFLGMYPEKNVILISYSEDYALQWGRAVRDILTKFGKPLFGRTVSRDASSNTDWKMERSLGGMISVGIGGGITGRGGDLIIIDDLIKNRQEAASDATKKYHREEYDSSIRTRLEPGGTVVVVATRWALDDLPGHLHEERSGGDPWEFIDFPALAMLPHDVDDFDRWEDELGRKVHEVTDEEGNVELVGDALWPEREPTENLLQTRQSIDPLVWAALYQQNPALSSDLMFRPENWQEYKAVYRTELMGSCTKLVRVWDLAASDKKGDWTVGCLMGLHRSGLIYVFDVQRVRKNATAVEELVKQIAELDGRKVKIMIEQERAGAGKSVLAHYQKILMGWIVEEARAEASKESRAMLYSSKQGNGLVYLPDEAAWKSDWVKEHEGFPNIRHDDQVDTGAYAFNDLTLGFFESAFWSPVESPRPLVYFGDPATAGLALMNRS